MLRFLAILALGAMLVGQALAHHGWFGTGDGNIALTGVIGASAPENPGGGLAEVDGSVSGADLAEGEEVTASGAPLGRMADRRIAAERLRVGDRRYEPEPDRP